MAAHLRRKRLWSPSPRAVGKMIRVGAASLGLGLAVAVAAHFRSLLEAPMVGFPLAPVVAVLAVCVAGALLYPVLLFAFGGVTPAEARGAFKRRKSDKIAPPADLSR
jgi:putative peptidoglycan lipid II flippase